MCLCRDKSQYLIMQRIADLDYEFPEDFPEAARDLVAHLLVEEPTDRIGYKSLQEIKDHAFFDGTAQHALCFNSCMLKCAMMC